MKRFQFTVSFDAENEIEAKGKYDDLKMHLKHGSSAFGPAPKNLVIGKIEKSDSPSEEKQQR